MHRTYKIAQKIWAPFSDYPYSLPDLSSSLPDPNPIGELLPVPGTYSIPSIPSSWKLPETLFDPTILDPVLIVVVGNSTLLESLTNPSVIEPLLVVMGRSEMLEKLIDPTRFSSLPLSGLPSSGLPSSELPKEFQEYMAHEAAAKKIKDHTVARSAAIGNLLIALLFV